MKVYCSNLTELKAVAKYVGISIKTPRVCVAFPYLFKADNDRHPFKGCEDMEISFEEFETRYLRK